MATRGPSTVFSVVLSVSSHWFAGRGFPSDVARVRLSLLAFTPSQAVSWGVMSHAHSAPLLLAALAPSQAASWGRDVTCSLRPPAACGSQFQLGSELGAYHACSAAPDFWLSLFARHISRSFCPPPPAACQLCRLLQARSKKFSTRNTHSIL